MFIKNLSKNMKTYLFALFVLFFLFVLFTSLGQINRWDLLQQIAMADNFLMSGSLYPDINNPGSSDVSPYFPGVALLGILIAKIGFSSNLVEIMLGIASITIFLFFFIQYKIAQYLFGQNITPYKFVPIVVISSLFLFPEWFKYAAEFKPDILALTIGFICMHLVLHREVKATYFQVIIGGLIAGLAIIFKQQYLAFIIGLSCQAIIFPTKKRILFSLSALIIIIGVFTIIYYNENAWFWSVEILKDDGFEPLKILLFNHFNMSIPIVSLLVFYFGYIKFVGGYFSTKISYPGLNFKDLFSSPWAWGTSFSILAALASTFKAGGNSGNTELGLILSLPLFALLLSYMKEWVLIAIAMIAVYAHVPQIYLSIKNYNNALELLKFIESDALPGNLSIASGSNVYFAARKYNSSGRTAAYWPISLINNNHPREGIDTVIQSFNPQILITDGFVDGAVVATDHNYTLVFRNAIGSVLMK